MICGQTPNYGLVYRWLGQWVGSCQISKNQISLDLIEIIQFGLKIYDLWRHPHLWLGGLMGGGETPQPMCGWVG